ncbi:MAG: DivIVA domain-containing protein [Ruminococcus sp.]|nr:DivIVA domain-containing protein [Ruminococcus sp.]MBQ1617064.1 DivIVA domain-containing protein [Ruminococcus sp.]MBQ1898953.1 DivIVA domain-containing protein [Ruminococcus sp.]MBQ4239028.1 DivIVA domain-containing protein [Ruminococcus sp.]
MLTIDEIREISFRRAGKNGYNAADVDDFIDEVTATVEQLIAEKNDCVRKMDILATKIEQYREDEETVRNALLTSQKLSDTTIKEAKNKADYIVKSAEKKSRAILTEAEMATEREKDKFEALHAETAKLRSEILALYKKHIAMVEEFPKEEDVKKKRAELDEKYPFEPVENMIPADEAPADNAEQTADVQPDAADDDVKIRPELKREKPDKFGKLKFGDNYDVE